MSFGGSTYDPELDGERLSTQYERVFAVMADGEWRTFQEIASEAGLPLTAVPGISARLRDFRKPERGSHTVERRRRGDGKSGVFEYRLIIRVPMPETQQGLWA